MHFPWIWCLQVKREYENFYMRQPSSLADHYAIRALMPEIWTVEEKLAELDGMLLTLFVIPVAHMNQTSRRLRLNVIDKTWFQKYSFKLLLLETSRSRLDIHVCIPSIFVLTIDLVASNSDSGVSRETSWLPLPTTISETSGSVTITTSR